MTSQERSYTQVCYVTTDVDVAVSRWIAATGAGPFYKISPATEDVVYRGGPGHDTYTAAMGFLGTTNIEFVQPTNDAPSVFQEVLAARGDGGLHHVFPNLRAMSGSDYDEQCALYESLGYEAAVTLTIPGIGRAAFYDAVDSLGSFIEALDMGPEIFSVMNAQYQAHIGWDGQRPIRAFEELLPG